MDPRLKAIADNFDAWKMRETDQITHIDAKNCFLDSLSDRQGSSHLMQLRQALA